MHPQAFTQLIHSHTQTHMSSYSLSTISLMGSLQLISVAFIYPHCEKAKLPIQILSLEYIFPPPWGTSPTHPFLFSPPPTHSMKELQKEQIVMGLVGWVPLFSPFLSVWGTISYTPRNLLLCFFSTGILLYCFSWGPARKILRVTGIFTNFVVIAKRLTLVTDTVYMLLVMTGIGS